MKGIISKIDRETGLGYILDNETKKSIGFDLSTVSFTPQKGQAVSFETVHVVFTRDVYADNIKLIS